MNQRQWRQAPAEYTRDLLIGAVPPAALTDWRYVAVSLLAGIITFVRPSGIDRLRSPVLVFDGLGLAVFAVAGAQKALGFGLDPVMAALLGMLTGIGGGMARDVLLAEIPTVVRAEIYVVTGPDGTSRSRHRRQAPALAPICSLPLR